MVEGMGKAIKYALFMANFVILIGGIVVFSIGVWTLADKAFMERLLGSDLYTSSASILIATGVIVTVVSFFGCMGAMREVKCMLLTFFIILFMIFITMLVGGILAYVFRNEVENRMRTEMIMTIPLYDNDTAVTDAWNAVQSQFKCCGIDEDVEQGYNIWAKKNSKFSGEKKVPASCCKSKDKTEINKCQDSPNENDAYLESCYGAVRDFVRDHALVVGGIGIGIACILIVGMILSCTLFMLIN
ncbi:tetraspanin-11-like [Centruroides sculpturatus]|uniref:tetraspanin-11-like n=1 Tax=Centruroides sculpturatus TaxID=218467 RepID=UPI000C6DDA1A|nr:tetraspanin-11-like [Centruroides sculpturatus]